MTDHHRTIEKLVDVTDVCPRVPENKLQMQRAAAKFLHNMVTKDQK